MARKPRAHERGLVIPPGGRTIPRTSPPRKQPASDAGDLEVSPIVAKHAGDLVSLAARIRICEACDRSSDARVYGTGHPLAPVFLLAERPSREDVETTGAFTAEADALDKALYALGIPLSWTYGATSVRCGVTPAKAEQIRACSAHLLAEIEAVEPRVLIAFGPRAAEAIRALDGRCGIRVPSELPQGTPARLRPGLVLIVTEPLPEGVTHKDAKRRLWRDLQQLPGLLQESAG